MIQRLMLSAGLAAALVLAATPVLAQETDDEVDSIVVTARASGAPMWEIATDEGTVILVGVLREVPKTAVWRPDALEAATARAQRILGPQEAKVSFMDFMRVIWRAGTIGRLPEGTTSADYLTPEDQARLDALEARYREDWSRDSFLITSSQLLNRRLGVGKDTGDDAETVVRRAAKKARIAIAPVGTVRGDDIIENLLNQPPQTQVPCIRAAMGAVEAGSEALTARGYAWTRYDVPGVMASPVEQALGQCWPWGDPALGVELRGQWVAAIQGAVAQPGVTMAVAPLRVLAENGGVLDQLKAQGFSIDGPEWTVDPDEPVARVSIRRDGDEWIARYALLAEAPAWVFTRSALARETEKPWRPEQFAVTTPGVRLERRGWYDALVAEDGGDVPDTVEIRFHPASTNLLADYDPALAFSDGAVALYSGHFEVLPVASVEAVEAMPSDIEEAEIDARPTLVAMRDMAGPVLMGGERRDTAFVGPEPAYVLFGAGEVVETEAVATLIDPGLPAWIGEALKSFTPRTLAYYQERLGPKTGGRPTVMVTWKGPTPNIRSMGGSVLDGMVVMTFEGEGVLEPNAAAMSTARWFVGHESAHFWLGQTLRHQSAAHSWITEGGADLMALRAAAALDPDYDPAPKLQQEVNDCVALADQPIDEAGDRNAHQARYACGAVFFLAAEGAARKADPSADLFTVLKPLIDAHRDADEAVDLDDWLAWFEPIAGAEAAAVVRGLVEDGAPDPAAAIARLFDLTGVAHARADGGGVTLI